MSVIVVGIKMPKDCTECRFAYDGMCLANWGRKSKIDVTNYCPLIELPAQHGRLIDVDALNDMINRSYPMTDRIDVHNGYAICQEMIKQLPTIIEAEASE